MRCSDGNASQKINVGPKSRQVGARLLGAKFVFQAIFVAIQVASRHAERIPFERRGVGAIEIRIQPKGLGQNHHGSRADSRLG